MKPLFIISWRNIWRHPGRTGVLIAAVVAGLWAGVLTTGAMNGMLQQRMDYLINREITHVQVHHPEFLAEGHSRMAIPEHERITAWLEDDPRVRSHTLRTLTDGMLQSPVRTSGVRIRGVLVESETRTTTFHENLVEGEYLDAEMRNAVILGKSLAETHNMEIGNRVVLTFEDTGNQLTAAAFHITGLFESASRDYDNRNIIVRSDDLSQLLADRPVYHEIAMILHDNEKAGAVAKDINAQFIGIKAQTWFERSPELRTLVDYGGVMLFVFTLVIMLALAFGILNTMLMAIFERMREIGMLLSIGMNRFKVFMMILLESIILTLTGALTGIALAGLSIAYFGKSGINLEMFATGLAEIGFDHIIYPFLTAYEFVIILGIVIVVTLLASIYPAWKAIRINPVEAGKR